MTKKLKWRLSKLPTVDEITLLVEKKILKEEEAKEILFSLETEEDRDAENLKSEIKFLREMVDKLSKDRNQIITIIKEIETPKYIKYSWYQQYDVWCSVPYAITTCDSINNVSNSTYNTLSGTLSGSMKCSKSDYDKQCAFTSIKTF